MSLLSTLPIRLALTCLIAWSVPAVFADSPDDARTRVIVGFAQDTLANDWRVAQVEAVRAVLAQHPGIVFRVTDARDSSAMQAQHIEDFLDMGVSVLITSPREQAALTPVLDRVYAAGVPVILLDRGIASDSYTTFIRPSNRPIAEAAARYLADRLGGRGTILMLSGIPGATPTIHRTEGFTDVMAHYPGIRVIARTANFLRSDAIRVTERMLAMGPRFDAIYAQSDSMATGARMALRAAGIDPAGLPIIGIDYIAEARDAIIAGEQELSFTYPTGGREGAEAALALLRGEQVPKDIILESIRVDRANAAVVEPIF